MMFSLVGMSGSCVQKAAACEKGGMQIQNTPADAGCTPVCRGYTRSMPAARHSVRIVSGQMLLWISPM